MQDVQSGMQGGGGGGSSGMGYFGDGSGNGYEGEAMSWGQLGQAPVVRRSASMDWSDSQQADYSTYSRELQGRDC